MNINSLLQHKKPKYKNLADQYIYAILFKWYDYVT